MIELNLSSADAVSGGNVFTDALALFSAAYKGGVAYMNALSYAGGTLSNYYGPETTLELFAGGNLGA